MENFTEIAWEFFDRYPRSKSGANLRLLGNVLSGEVDLDWV